MLRHGDRITWMERPCWPNYEYFWNCTLHFASIPTEDSSYQTTTVPTLFTKRYIDGKNLLPGNCNYMQLTKKGLEQHINNGKKFRKIYVEDAKFLSSTYDQTELYARSTDKPRTIQTLQGFLLGLYPPEHRHIVQSGPEMIDIFTVDYKKEELVPNNDACPEWGKHKIALAKSEKWMKHDAEIAGPIEKEVLEKSGFTDKDHMNQEQTYALHDCMMTHICHGFPLPRQITSNLWDAFHKDFTWKEWSPYFYPSIEKASRIGIGSFVKILRDNMNKAVAASHGNKGDGEKHRLYAFAGHDTTIMPLLAALRIEQEKDEPLWTPYASALTFELYSKSVGGDVETQSHDDFIRVVYNGKVVRLSFCAAEEDSKHHLCPLDLFFRYVTDLIPGSGDCSSK